jgi:hypothetical protein
VVQPIRLPSTLVAPTSTTNLTMAKRFIIQALLKEP